MSARLLVFGILGCLAATPALAGAQEYYIGEPVVKEGMQIVPNYLTGIQMDRHPPGMAMGASAVHLEADVHATKDEAHGFPEDAWIPYLTIKFSLTKNGGNFHRSGELYPMTAKDGPHYANNVDMAGPGTYKLTYTLLPPSSHGFIRHVDTGSGVPGWWQPIAATWIFTYPSKTK
jgi:hypothetical protein